jgi:4-hydroxybenzoate polyprenyltransferase/phosphoserine phosphatase
MQTLVTKVTPGASTHVPVVVDLDGTLIRSDLLVESAFALLGRHPAGITKLLTALSRGKASLKAHIAAMHGIDAAHLPFNVQVIELIREARSAGRPVYLASASNERYVSAVAAHLDLFEGWFASTAFENLSGAAKARRLVKAFGEGGFDYVGNDAADLAVWAAARQRIAVQPPLSVQRKLLALYPAAAVLRCKSSRVRNWVKLLRVHQWAKNVLVFVPLVTSHHFDLTSLGKAVASLFTFSLAASGIYLINDLVDVEADRKHRSKRLRPLAAGTIRLLDALAVAPILITAAVAAAFLLSPWFGVVLLGYLAVTTAYTFVLKRKLMVDVVTLATLYALRVGGGAAAIGVPVSEWLLAFAMFIFVALALIKRYTELVGLLDANLPDLTNRNYRKIDLDIVAALAAASGFNAVTVLTLYISSEAVHQHYAHPQVLWLVCPILMYWIGRVLLLAHRRAVDDDPILFAMRDKSSLVAGGLMCAIVIGAM